jgi:hypothetical protein
LKTIDDVFTELFGEINTKIIYDYLERKSCPISEICQKLEVFSMELGILMGTGRGQMLGSAGILEKTVLKVLCSRMGIECSPGRADFPDCVRELKEAYKQRRHAPPSKIEMEVKNP